MAELGTKCYESRMVGSVDKLISSSVLVYIPIMDYRAHICVYVSAVLGDQGIQTSCVQTVESNQ